MNKLNCAPLICAIMLQPTVKIEDSIDILRKEKNGNKHDEK